jgi:hypothetical protein
MSFNFSVDTNIQNQIENQIDNIIETTTQNLDNIDNIDNIDNTNMNKLESQTAINGTIDEGNIEVFNNALHQYLRIDEEIKTLMQAIRTRNEIKKNLGETLSSYLKTNQIKNVNLDGSYKGKRLESIINYTTTGFTKANVTEAIHNELKEDQEIFEKIMEALSKTSVMKEVCKLKITEEKQTRKKTGSGTITRIGRKQDNVLDTASSLLDNDND